MASAKTNENGGRKGRKRTASPPSPRLQKARRQIEKVTDRTRGQLMERLNFQRGALVAALEDLARGLDHATRLSSSPMSRQMLEVGGRAVRGASSRLGEHSIEELFGRAREAVNKRPVLSLAGLLGAGLLAGRLVRASGSSESELGREG